MASWLVTGGTGFLGRHLLRALTAGADGGDEVVALGRRCPAGWDLRRFVAADLEQPDVVARAIAAVSPDVVIHAAGRTPPATPAEFERANLRATLHLLDALARAGRPVRVVLVGSAAELGPVDEIDLPVGEDHPCRPADAYAWSKCLATVAGLLVRPPLDVVVTRVFNVIGPGLPATQALGQFASRLLDPAPGPLLVGDLDARRDFVDVRDVARALVALAWSGRAGRVYHVGTGLSHRVGDGLERLIRRSCRSIEVRIDPARALARGPGDSRADIRRIVADTAWRPAIGWEQSLDDLWDEAAARARAALALTA
jgi:nucleoside-diphosphate-sugar epimerase